MTLSYVGQLLDELSILWTLAVAYSFWLPKTYFPRCIKSRYDPAGRWAAGSEGRVGTMTWVRVTHRPLPVSPASPAARGRRGVCCSLFWDRTLHRAVGNGKGCAGLLSTAAACLCEAAEGTLHGKHQSSLGN